MSSPDAAALPPEAAGALERARAELDRAAALPPEEQVGAFDAVHRALQEALATVEGDRAPAPRR